MHSSRNKDVSAAMGAVLAWRYNPQLLIQVLLVSFGVVAGGEGCVASVGFGGLQSNVL